MMRCEGTFTKTHDQVQLCTCDVLDERLIGKLARMKVDSWVVQSRCVTGMVKQFYCLHASAC